VTIPYVPRRPYAVDYNDPACMITYAVFKRQDHDTPATVKEAASTMRAGMIADLERLARERGATINSEPVFAFDPRRLPAVERARVNEVVRACEPRWWHRYGMTVVQAWAYTAANG
jgi:hypothetical protein